ncbi:hypothetical protein CONPUDRAFT_116927 [Coniophora puteana RWD-64-598 SS2]|uniref:Uncharacterized protein n=1 Tax=Coniophora puteana (strain RWD-64-598) TaxID=741705 RepID=A0A5M3N048_CONPW|nr:uncharacterized protein CONPUDRAFT_116927 [Coniophora puteana RWD-64-598 SS2]EIW84759.1 hypothetical protein CONPUDRAFT_116927 [Coniophora puteana RWD-64-598 SS2]
MAGLSAYDIYPTFRVPEPQRSQNLKRAFARLINPREDPMFVKTYTFAIKTEFGAAFSPNNASVSGFTSFTRACLEAGIVRTMVTVAREVWPNENTPKDRYIAQYHALWSLCEMMRTGNLSERRTLLDMMLQEDVVGLCLQLLRHQLCLMQQLSINVLRLLSGESFLGEKVSSSVASDTIEAVCLYISMGSDHFIDQLTAPETTWQSQMMVDRTNLTTDECARYCSRVYSICQESAIWVIHGILCTSSAHPPRFCADILKKRPQIVDLLFDCAIIDRQPWYPETRIVSVTCEIMVLLIRWPDHIIPGAASPVDKAFKSQDWKALSQAMSILTSRRDWVEKIVEVWLRMQEEDFRKITQTMLSKSLNRVVSRPIIPESSIPDLTFTGAARACILRLITTLTHAADVCGISNAQVESLLHIAYQGCRKARDSVAGKDPIAAVENTQEIFRPPPLATFMNTSVESPVSVAPEWVIGPTALMRMYSVLAQRKALDGIPALKKPPSGLSSTTSLKHIRQITHPDIILRAIKISQLRLRTRMDEGRERHRTRTNNDYDVNDACATFMSAAELAAALVALDNHTHGAYAAEVLGARKQLVIALGNASEMALNMGRHQRAFHLASSAVSAAENIPEEEGLSLEIMEKNKRRVNNAYAALQRQ